MSRWLMTENEKLAINSDYVKLVFITEKNEIMVKMNDDSTRIISRYDSEEIAKQVLRNFMASSSSNFYFAPNSAIFQPQKPFIKPQSMFGVY